MSKFTFSHTTGKRIPIDDAMIALRTKLLPAFGYVIRDECSLRLIYGKERAAKFRCVENEKMDCDWGDKGVLISGYHGVFIDHEGDYHFPEEVMKAAHAIDKSKPAKVKVSK